MNAYGLDLTKRELDNILLGYSRYKHRDLDYIQDTLAIKVDAYRHLSSRYRELLKLKRG